MTDLNADVQMFLADAGEVLKRTNPEMEFVFVLVPFHKEQLKHLSTEEKRTMEKRAVAAVQKACKEYLKQ